MIDKIISLINEQQDANVERMLDLLRIPSISTDTARNADTRKGAEWVHKLFTDCGIESEIVDTPGHPAILADTGEVDGNGLTVLIYGHYDVQPTGDETLWDSPAFEPTIRNGNVYARGSADDKGQVLAHMIAAESWKKVAGKLPIRVKFLIEGEEEVSSPNLEPLIREHKDRLACDYVALSDTPKFDENTPAITYGTKGLVYKEIIVTGAKQDLHSGSYGGTIINPGNALAHIFSSLKDADQRVTIPGFYDDVIPISDDDRRRMEELPFDEAGYLASMGAPALDGEKGFKTLERRWARPTLDVNGLLCGFTGEGAMTVLPAKAMGKVSMRLVPGQNHELISKAFDEAVMAAAPKGVKVEIKEHGACAAYVCPLKSTGMTAAAKALELGFGKAPFFTREGGTLPILPLFKEVLGADSLMMGYCMPDCNAHGPNEYFGLSDFHNGIKSSAHLIDQLARV